MLTLIEFNLRFFLLFLQDCEFYLQRARRRDALVQANIALINDEGHREFVQVLDDEAFRLEKRVLGILHKQ